MGPRVVTSLLATAAAVLACTSACDAELDEEQGIDAGSVNVDEGAVGEGADDAADGLGRGRSAIVDGSAEKGRPAVVAIVYPAYEGDRLICSGVLVSDTIIVTAAHCLHPHVTGVEADELVVVFGPSIDQPKTRVRVQSGAYHPEWRLDDPDGHNDVAALRLALPAPVDPIPLGPGPAAGEEVVLVGYGDTNLHFPSTGEKRSGAAVVGELGDTWFRMDRSPAITCAGDSGGATLAVIDGAEVLLGVHSRGDCETSVWDERMDVHANGFLKAFMGEFGGCMEDGACAVGCPSPDPDCPCAADSECNEACGDADPDCTEESTCDDDDEDCGCDDGDCQSRAAPPPGGGWGSAGCSVASDPARDSAPLALAALAVGLAAARRMRRAR